MAQLAKHKLNSIIRSVQGGLKEENFQRPNHSDFKTSTELKAERFSGVRQNEISRMWEFWIDGEIKKTVSEAAVQADNSLLGKAHVEVFHMRDHTEILPDKGN